jgi:exo-1,4-beta-D-glucosaminidase
MNQVSSYEAIRPMFEAFAVNKFHSTGDGAVDVQLGMAYLLLAAYLITFLMPNGAFYGTRKAGGTPVGEL